MNLIINKRDLEEIAFKYSTCLLINLLNKQINKEPAQIPERFVEDNYDDEGIKRREKEALLKQLERFDENVRHAILLRREKDSKSEFYRKLESLNDRISIYKDIFWSRQPSFMTINNKYAKSKNLPKIHKNHSRTDVSPSESPKKHPKARKSQFDSIMQEIINYEDIGLKSGVNSNVSKV